MDKPIGGSIGDVLQFVAEVARYVLVDIAFGADPTVLW